MNKDCPIFEPSEWRLTKLQKQLCNETRSIASKNFVSRAIKHDIEASFPTENYSDLFKNNDPIKIFKFLDEKTSVMEELSIFLSVDIKTFVRSLIKRLSNLSI